LPDTLEADLLRRAAAGDTDAFAVLVDRYAARIYGVCFSVLGNHADAQDCVQETFLKAFRTMNRFQFASSFYTWLYRIALNNCYDLLRHNQRHLAQSLDEPVQTPDGEQAFQLADDQPLPDVQVESLETVALVRRALSMLPEHLQRIIVLRDLEGLPYDRIAEIEHLREGTVKSRLFRARIQLADRLRQLEQKGGAVV